MYDMARLADRQVYDGKRGIFGRKSRQGRSPQEQTSPTQQDVYVGDQPKQGNGLTVNVGGPITFAEQNRQANMKTFGGKGAGGNTNISADVASANQVYAPQESMGGGSVGRGSFNRGPQPPGAPTINIGNVTGGKINQPKPTPRRKAGK